MLTLLSPAKTLDLKTNYQQSYLPNDKPAFLNESAKLIKKCKQLSSEEIQKLMAISENLANINVDYYKSWNKNYTQLHQNCRPAAYMFKGDVYTGLNAYNLNDDALKFFQNNTLILSGLYGLLKPLDLILPYRLEMGRNLPEIGTLHNFWRNLVTTTINNSKSKYIINLASAEYFKAIDQKQLKPVVITPIFQDEKNGNYKVISFFAKKARGLMARFIAEHKICDPSKLKNFDYESYKYIDELSSPTKLVFRREAS